MRTITITDRSRTLLETLEARGLNPLSACRSGYCRTCVLPLVRGEVEHREEAFVLDGGEVLPCCAVPKSQSVSVVLN